MTKREREQELFERRVNSATEEFKKLMERDYRASQELAYKESGCLVAWPAWWMRPDGKNERVDCLHLDCRIRRGEYGKMPEWNVRLNAEFRDQLHNWLRFAKETVQGRRSIARLYWAMKKEKKFDMMSCVWVGVMA